VRKQRSARYHITATYGCSFYRTKIPQHLENISKKLDRIEKLCSVYKLKNGTFTNQFQNLSTGIELLLYYLLYSHLPYDRDHEEKLIRYVTHFPAFPNDPCADIKTMLKINDILDEFIQIANEIQIICILALQTECRIN
jgi:hypothetical protein